MDPSLYAVAMEGKLDDLKQYTNQFALQFTKNNNSVLHVIAEFGHSHCVTEILDAYRPLLHRENTHGDTPLHMAAAGGHGDVVESLINFVKPPADNQRNEIVAANVGGGQGGSGAGEVREMLKARNHDGDTPLHLAARSTKNNRVGVVSLLTKADRELDYMPNKAGETPLYLVVRWGSDVAVVSEILKNCKSPAYGGPGGKTAMHAAVTDSSKDSILDKLLDWKQDLIKERDTKGWTSLHFAAHYGNLEAVKKLLDKDKSMAYANNDEGNTALHIATATGDVLVMNEILQKFPDCWEMANSKGRTILHFAADVERDVAINFILKKPWVSGLINRKDNEGNTPLHVLASKGKAGLHMYPGADMLALNNETVTPLDILNRELQWRERERGIDYYYQHMDPNMYTAAMKDQVDDLDPYSADQFALQVTPNGNTLLHVAAQCNSSVCVPAILSKCPSLLRRANNNGDTPIHVALTRKNFHVVDSLMDFAKSAEGGGAAAVREMLRARNHDGDTPLHLAARYWKRESMVRWKSMLDWALTSQDLGLDHGPNKAGETPLYLYVNRGYDVDVLSLMLKTCTPPEYGGPSGRTALHAAVIRGRDEFSDKLIEWRNDLIKEPDSCGLTPLHYAANNGDVKVVQKLLDKDKSVAYITANNDKGDTALHMATAKGHTELMKELLSKCPYCWEMLNRKGRNILHIAADLESYEATKYISEQPWKYDLVNLKDHEGNTPMHVLAHNYNIYEGKGHLFLSFYVGADMDALNNEGLTPSDILFSKTGGRKYWLLHQKFLRGLDKKDGGGKGNMNYREQKERHEKVKQKATEEMGKMAETHMIVAALISTISFAAGFTIPGGYHGDQGPNQGMAVLVREAAFKAFVISNTIALICSTSSVFLYVSASIFKITGREGEKQAHRYEIAFWLILIAMLAMMLAFSTGAYVVLAHSLGLAIATCAIACSSFIVYAFELKQHFAEEKAYVMDSLSSFGRRLVVLLYRFCCRCICFR